MMDEAKKNVMQLRSLFFILCESDLGKIYVAHGFLFFERMAAFGRIQSSAMFIDSDYSSKLGLMHNRSSHKVKVTSAIASSTGGNCVRLARINIQPTTNGQSKNMKVVYLKVRLAKRFGHPKENMMKPVPNRIPAPRTALIISQAGINGSP